MTLGLESCLGSSPSLCRAGRRSRSCSVDGSGHGLHAMLPRLLFDDAIVLRVWARDISMTLAGRLAE